MLSEERDCLIVELTSSEAAITELARELAAQAELLEIVRSGALAHVAPGTHSARRGKPGRLAEAGTSLHRPGDAPYSAELSVSPVRMRITRSISVTKILPSPTLPVLAALSTASMT